MTWHVPVAISLIFSYTISPYLLKKNANLPSRTRRLAWQFFFCAALACLVALGTGSPLPLTSMALLAIGAIGCVNAFGAYCQWRAMAISLSRTSLFTYWDDLIAMGLGYALLSEAQFLTPLLGLGIVIAVGAVIAMPYARRGKTADDQLARAQWVELIGWVARYSVIWGGVSVAMRYFGLKGVAIPSFLAAWYSGAFVGALAIRFLSSASEVGVPLAWRDLRLVFALSCAIGMALSLKYWAFGLAPVTVLQPIYQVGEMVMPTVVGLVVFREHKTFKPAEKLLFVLAIVGGLTIALSF
ncbi:hypothetical protein HY477_03620 [Candidatus Uhrbacteria bacterium]|nr:hypothetical protein [Candidatus Uhrbacteria bacterium]